MDWLHDEIGKIIAAILFLVFIFFSIQVFIETLNKNSKDFFDLLTLVGLPLIFLFFAGYLLTTILDLIKGSD